MHTAVPDHLCCFLYCSEFNIAKLIYIAKVLNYFNKAAYILLQQMADEDILYLLTNVCIVPNVKGQERENCIIYSSVICILNS